MIILHISDIHYDKALLSEIKNRNYDVLCISGDLLAEPGCTPINVQINEIISILKKVKKPLFVASGNHDLDGKWLRKIKKAHLGGENEKIKNIKIGVVNFGCDDFSKFKKCDVLVTHVPPFGSKTAICSQSGNDLGDKILAKAIKKGQISPRYILCGHIHNPMTNYEIFEKINILNASCKAYDIDIQDFL